MSSDSAWEISLAIAGVTYVIAAMVGVLLFRAKWTFLASFIFGCLFGALSLHLLLKLVEMSQHGHGTIG